MPIYPANFRVEAVATPGVPAANSGNATVLGNVRGRDAADQQGESEPKALRTYQCMEDDDAVEDPPMDMDTELADHMHDAFVANEESRFSWVWLWLWKVVMRNGAA